VFDDVIRGWGGEEIVVRFDEPTSTWMFIGVHSTLLGPAMGGVRLKPYPTPETGLNDVVRLSAAMTMKQAAAGLPYGGGKAVLAVTSVPPSGSAGRDEILLRYADLLETLHGIYVTAADMNTGEADMDLIGRRTSYVLGRSRDAGGAGDPAVGTALGVFHGIRASCLRAFGSADLAERSVLIQGAGAVGDRLAGHLREAGAHVMVADIHPERAASTAARVGGEAVAVDAVVGADCDVYAPCATGGVLSIERIPLLKCRVVAGAANNQLATSDDARRMQDAGILYAPDYIVNAGGVIWLAGYETLGWDDATMDARLAGIGQTLEDLYREAEAEGITTVEAADRLARSRLQAPRA
jgi:glutamate dehydrogenase/leucine dehydrogenase